MAIEDDRTEEEAARRAATKIVVLDDFQGFVDAITDSLTIAGYAAEGFTSVSDFARAARSGALHDAKLMLFDMNLEPRGDEGAIMKAPDAILVAKTYVPQAYIIVFTQPKINLEDCIECVRLGALGLVPRPEGRDQLLKAATVYARVGDPELGREAVIHELWRQLQSPKREEKGQLLEMLAANLLSSVDGLSLIANNWLHSAGEVDLVIRNDIKDEFWQRLNSLFVLVECKNTADPSEKKEFHAFKAKVEAKASCRAGIMVSWKEVSGGYKELQQHLNPNEETIFLLNRENLEHLISCPRQKRQEYLTVLFSKQG